MKITHVSYSKSGGAGKVAYRLFKEQKKIEENEVEFLYKISKDLYREPFTDLSGLFRSVLDKYFISNKETKTLFSYLREKNEKKIVDKIESLDGVTHLHWTQGLIKPNYMNTNWFKLKPMIWTIHDFAPLTGGCHVVGSCKEYLNSCEKCPQVNRLLYKNISENYLVKRQFIKKKNNLILITPSQWMRKKTLEIIESQDDRVRVVNNPVSETFFLSKNKELARASLNISKNKYVLGFVSSKINNAIKRYDLLLSILNQLSENEAKNLIILNIGAGSISQRTPNRIEIRNLGYIDSEERMAQVYTAMDVLISVSQSETFGLSVAEASACKTPSLVMTGTSTAENIKQGLTGFVAKDSNDFLSKLRLLIANQKINRDLGDGAHELARSKWSIDIVNAQYVELYKEVLDMDSE